MKKQEAKLFSVKMTQIAAGAKKELDDQINDWLAEHPDQKVSAISYFIGGNFEKALIVFDIFEERPNTRQQNREKAK